MRLWLALTLLVISACGCENAKDKALLESYRLIEAARERQDERYKEGWFNILDERGILVKHVEYVDTLPSGVCVFQTWDCKKYWVDPKACRISSESPRESRLREGEYELEKLFRRLNDAETEIRILPGEIEAAKLKVETLKSQLHEGEI